MKFQFMLARDQQCLAHYTFKVIIGMLGLVCRSVISDSMDCRPPLSSVHGILQARILEWVAMLSSRASSQPRDRTQVSRIAGRFFTI